MSTIMNWQFAFSFLQQPKVFSNLSHPKTCRDRNVSQNSASMPSIFSLFTFQIQSQDRKRRNTEQHLERHDPADDHGEEEVEEKIGEKEEEEEPGGDEEGVQ